MIFDILGGLETWPIDPKTNVTIQCPLGCSRKEDMHITLNCWFILIYRSFVGISNGVMQSTLVEEIILTPPPTQIMWASTTITFFEGYGYLQHHNVNG